MGERVFRGSIVSSRWTKGWPLDMVEVRREQIVLRPWGRRSVALRRGEVAAIEFEKVRLPLVWMTCVFFSLSDGSRLRKLFTPWSVRAFRSCLVELGWPTIDRPPYTLSRNGSDAFR